MQILSNSQLIFIIIKSTFINTMAVVIFGKILLAISLSFQAYLFLNDPTIIKGFNADLTDALAGCDCLGAQVTQLLHQYLRFVVVGLLFSSVLMAVTKFCIFKVTVLLGLLVILWTENHQLCKTTPSLNLLANQELWELVAVIGGVIYLMGAECSKPCKKDKEEKAKH